jgi:(S)-2-hydroxyglutarate dehydrogenase
MGSVDAAVIGGGIVGLSICKALADSGFGVTLLEKETQVAQHQTSRNSGVVHAGPYYSPGSRKAEFCVRGNALMAEFARAHNIPFKVTGKLLMATSKDEISRLNNLASRAKMNGVPSEIIGRQRILELEPHAAGIAALHVKNTAIINYGLVAKKLAELCQDQGAELKTGTEVKEIHPQPNGVTVVHGQGSLKARLVINAAGLYSDDVARTAGLKPGIRIIPFRGEYFHLSSTVSHMVQGLIYPIPNPELPFLGVHLTRMINGDVHAGPNAVLAFAKEGYLRNNIVPKELWATLSYPGFLKFASHNLGIGVREVTRSVLPQLFARDLSKLVPGITKDHLQPSPSGVRAQAIGNDGKLIDDFEIRETSRQIHILNAPSPAATASFAIAEYVRKLALRHLEA